MPMSKMRRQPPALSDVIIIGGGHAGSSLAACLGAAGLNVTVLERGLAKAKRDARLDGRTLALSFRTMQVLRQAGVERLIKSDACPILDIRVADQDSPSFLDFRHKEIGDDPFGWIIENNLFNRALEKRIGQMKNVRVVNGAAVKAMERDDVSARVILEDGRSFEAALVVGADGRKSLCRELAGIPVYGWSYKQTAIVCTIKHSKPHHNVAVEHFQPGGPFATLPMTKRRSSIVWTEKTAAAEALMKMDAREFTDLLQEKVRSYLGDITLERFSCALLTLPATRVPSLSPLRGERERASRAGEGGYRTRFSYPLILQHAEHYTAKRLALIGDAAHGIHPIAGQGFNLGMGDIDVLAEELVGASRLGLDLGNSDLLRRYEKRRKFDNGNMVLMTDVLDRLFSNSIAPVQAVRRFGLGVVQRLPRLRHFFMRTAMGG